MPVLGPSTDAELELTDEYCTEDYLIAFSWPNQAPNSFRVVDVVTVPAVRVSFVTEEDARAWAEAMLHGLPERAAYALATATPTP